MLKLIIAYPVFCITLLMFLPLCLIKSQRKLWVQTYNELIRMHYLIKALLKIKYKTTTNTW